MWNITSPETSTAPRGRITATSAKPIELEADGPQRTQGERGERPDEDRPDPHPSPEQCHGSNRYPTPQMVLMIWGSEGSSSIFSLSRRTWTVTVLVPASSAAS